MKEQKMSFDEKLSLLLDAINFYEDEYKTSFTRDDLGYNVNFLVTPEKIKVRNELYNFISDLFEYNKLPEVYSDEEYFNLKPYAIDFKTEHNESELWTASKDFFHNYNLIYSTKYYKGIYKFSNGIYASPEKDDAIKYAKKVKEESLYLEQDFNLRSEEFSEVDYTLSFKIPRAKVIKDTDLLYIISSIFHDEKVTKSNNPKEKQLLNFVNKLYNNEEKYKLEFLFENDLAKLAIILGYDAIYITKDYEFYFQVLNRNKICVSETSYQRAELQLIFKQNDF